MYRERKIKLQRFKLNNISIRPILNIDEECAIGNWNQYYPFLKMLYNSNTVFYPNYSYIMTDHEINIGYFISADIINEDENVYLNKYERKMILFDLGIYSRSYAKNGKLLINYLIEISRKCYCKTIEIKKTEGFDYFYAFLKRYYKVSEDNQNYYLIINNPMIRPNAKNLKIFEDDNISLKNLYFLYGLKFKIYRNKCVYKYNDYSIVVDRKTGLIKLPANIVNYQKKKLIFTDSYRNLIHLLCNLFANGDVELICINDLERTSNLFDACFKETAIIFKNPLKVEKNYSLLNKLYISYGYRHIYAYSINFDVNCLSYESNCKRIDIRNYLVNQIKYLDVREGPFKEVYSQLKKVKEFNKNLEVLKRFDFRMGNSFAGIKKFTIIFDEKVIIKHNGKKDETEETIIDKKEIIDILKSFSFANWKECYESSNPNYDNSWNISLVFENKTITYKGLDEYPNIWLFVIEFIEKYSSLKLIEEEKYVFGE